MDYWMAKGPLAPRPAEIFSRETPPARVILISGWVPDYDLARGIRGHLGPFETGGPSAPSLPRWVTPRKGWHSELRRPLKSIKSGLSFRALLFKQRDVDSGFQANGN